MAVDIDKVLAKRYFVRQHFEWLMDQVAYHRDMKQYFKNAKIHLWTIGAEKGTAKIYETPT